MTATSITWERLQRVLRELEDVLANEPIEVPTSAGTDDERYLQEKLLRAFALARSNGVHRSIERLRVEFLSLAVDRFEERS